MKTLLKLLLVSGAAISLAACSSTNRSDDMAAYEEVTPEQTVSVEDSTIEDSSAVNQTSAEDTPSLGASSSGLGK